MLRDPKGEFYRNASREKRQAPRREERAWEAKLSKPPAPRPVALPDTIRCGYCGADVGRDGCPNDGPAWPGRHWRP
jgi:hypothetical protein